MKKYLYFALALPLLFACSSEDFDEKVMSNDQFAGIAKVDATFTMDEGAITRFDGGVWNPEQGDVWGFAWMGGGEATAVAIDGQAWQNHNLIQKGNYFEPQTNIYVGNYYLYRPFDETTVNKGAINFKSLENQPLAEGYESAKQPWKDLAKTSINLGDCWTVVTKTGTTIAGTTWDKAGMKQKYDLYAAPFSNQTGLDLTYKQNNPKFAADKKITGATDIDVTCTAGTEVGAADIYKVTVGLSGAAKSFTYAPTASPNGAGTNHKGDFWADKKNLNASGYTGFTFADAPTDVITLANEDGVSTGNDGGNGWFWFNSLPVTAGNATAATAIQTKFTTSYGVVTCDETVGSCAWAMYYTAPKVFEWRKLADADNATKTPKEWDITKFNTFVNQYGNHRGKFAFAVDFSKGVMDKMCIKNDEHLQKLLKYYIASGKNNENVSLNLDADKNGEFRISKLSIALLQTINAAGPKTVKVHACALGHAPARIVVTQDGIAATEVPDLQNVFDASTDVILASGTTWTWKERTAPAANVVTVDANVKSLTNEGTLTVNATNIQLSSAAPITNAKGATMNITKVTTVKNALTNLGTINVGAADNTAAELRAYNVEIKNDATDHTDLTKRGTINNYGVIGSSDGTTGVVNNYGEINVMDNAAITLLKSNELGIPAFNTPFDGTHKMGSVVIPTPTALVSVANDAENGFIKYTWTGATYATPAGVVKYNTIVVSGDITFTAAEPEIQYIEFNGTRTQVVNPTNGTPTDPGYLTQLQGIRVNAGKSIIIEKTNGIVCKTSAFLGAGATIYKGGVFEYPATAPTKNYFGTWSKDQIVKW